MITRKLVWLALLWVLVTLFFPSVRESIPLPVLLMSYAVAGALIVTGRWYLIDLLIAIGLLIISPIWALIEYIARLLGIDLD